MLSVLGFLILISVEWSVLETFFEWLVRLANGGVVDRGREIRVAVKVHDLILWLSFLFFHPGFW